MVIILQICYDDGDKDHDVCDYNVDDHNDYK